MPVLGSRDEPVTTGSIAPPVEVHRPLPATLAYSDAARIGQAAAAALSQAASGETTEWVNSATGSSGTVEDGGADTQAKSENCRNFSTIVTSIGGVHQYGGRVCRGDDGRSVVDIQSPDAAAS